MLVIPEFGGKGQRQENRSDPNYKTKEELEKILKALNFP
jgi:hypothetical protein